MKLIQLNIWAGALGRHLLGFFKAQQADILMLQEVISSPEGNASFFTTMQGVQAYARADHAFFSAKLDMRQGSKRVFYGNAILGKTPLTQTYDEFLHLCYKTDWEEDTDDYNIRLFQHAVATLPSDRHVHLVNHHGYHDRQTKMGNELTARHCARIAEYIAGLTGPVILTGDFNLAPDSPSLAPLNAALRNLCIENDIQTTRNQFARSMTTVDYIWVSEDVTVNDFAVLPDLVSDHAALLLDFDV